jgi:hypothetical protein
MHYSRKTKKPICMDLWLAASQPDCPAQAWRDFGTEVCPQRANARGRGGGLVCIAGAYCQDLHRQPLDFNDFHSMFLMTYAL